MESLPGIWRGSLVADTGEQLEAVFKVADTGNPIYEYHTKSGPREAELTALGQTFRFVPAEGGVANVVVDALSVSAQHITFGLLLSHEKTSAYGSEATLSQGQTNVVCEAVLSGTELELRMTITSRTSFSQPGYDVPGGDNVVVCRGRLHKQ